MSKPEIELSHYHQRYTSNNQEGECSALERRDMQFVRGDRISRKTFINFKLCNHQASASIDLNISYSFFLTFFKRIYQLIESGQPIATNCRQLEMD